MIVFPRRYLGEALCCRPPKRNYLKHQTKFNCAAVVSIWTSPPSMFLSIFPLFLPQTQTTVMFVAPRGSNLQYTPRPFASGLRLLGNDAVRLHWCQVVQQNVEIHKWTSQLAEESQTYCTFAVFKCLFTVGGRFQQHYCDDQWILISCTSLTRLFTWRQYLSANLILYSQTCSLWNSHQKKTREALFVWKVDAKSDLTCRHDVYNLAEWFGGATQL